MGDLNSEFLPPGFGLPRPGGKKQRGSPGGSPRGSPSPAPPDFPDQSMQAEVRHIQQHYFKFYSCLSVESASDELCVFRLASKREPERQLLISLNASTAYTVLEDTKVGQLVNQRFESFEQVMSAMDQGDFGDLLCGLAAAKLAQCAAEEDDGAENAYGGGQTSPMMGEEEYGGALMGGGMMQMGGMPFGQVVEGDPFAEA